MSQTTSRFPRRHFVLGAGAAGLLAAGRRGVAAEKRGASPLSFGYAAITWGETKPADPKATPGPGAKQAIADIAAAGYRGIQLRLPSLKEFANPEELKAELAKAKLTF